MKIFGILNITSDSFSDGGEYLSSGNAIQKAEQLISDGADVIEISAQSSNPDAEQIDPELEWTRIEPVLRHCIHNGAKVSVDTYKPYVIRQCIRSGVHYINDITSFRDTETLSLAADIKDSDPQFILMFSHNQGNRADKNSFLTTENAVNSILGFFQKKKLELAEKSVPLNRIIFDPGMGFFLSPDPLVSIEVLRNLKTFREKLGRVMISVSRKSFIGALSGGILPKERGPGTLACELFSYRQGVDFIRTHDVKQLKEALILEKYLE